MIAPTGIWRRGGRARRSALVVSICLVLTVLVPHAEAETPLASVNVPSTSPTGVTIELPPIPGSNPVTYYAYYRFEVSGRYIYDTASTSNIADAECTKFGSPAGNIDPSWQKDRWGAKTQDPLDDLYDLYVEGKPVDWKPVRGEPECATEDSLYGQNFASSTFTNNAAGKKKVTFRVYDENSANNADLDGGLVVKIYPGGEPAQGPDDKFIETVTINTRLPGGASSVSALVAGEKYRIVARGSYSYSVSNDGWFADAECSVTGQSNPNVTYDPVWRPHRTFIAGDTTDYLDLLVDSTEKSWTPLIETTPGCNARDHTYKLEFLPATTNRVNFKVQSANHAFNAGLIYADIYLTRSQSTPPPDAGGVIDAGLAEANRNPAIGTPLTTFTVSAASRIPKEIGLPAQAQPNGSLKYFSNYRFEVSGSYVWDFIDPGNLADAECSKFARGRVGTGTVPIPDPTWQQNRFGATKFAEQAQQRDLEQDPLDLYVNGKNVEWSPLLPDGKGCSSSQDNVYDVIVPLTQSRKVQFQVYDPIGNHTRVADTKNVSDSDPSNNYSFTVKVFPAPEARSDPNEHVFIETVKVDTSKPAGTSSVSGLVAGQKYRFVASNIFTYDYRLSAQTLADAECSITPTDPVWQPQRTFPGVSPVFDLYGLMVEKKDQQWIPLFDTGGGCNTTPDHSYRLNYTAEKTGTINFSILAKQYSYIAGSLFVDIYLVKPAAGAGPGAPVDDSIKNQFFSAKSPSLETPMEVIKVQASSSKGSSSLKDYKAGQNYRLEVSGVYVYDFRYTLGNRADAECTQFSINGRHAVNDGRFDFNVNDTSWQSKRFAADQRSPGGDPFDLYVDGSQVDWQPLTADANFPQCNTKDHTYEYIFTPVRDIEAAVRPLNLKVFDSVFSNAFATGELTVKVFPAGSARSGPSDALLETLTVDASDPKGSKTTVPLTAGQEYRVVAEGVYNYDKRREEAKADPECTITDTFPSTDPVYKAQRTWDGIAPNDDMFDLNVNGAQVEWLPLFDSGGGCNSREHVYAIKFTPSKTDVATFRVRHTFHEVASGTLKVSIYRSGPTASVPSAADPGMIPKAQQVSGAPLAETTVSARSGAFTEVLLPGYVNSLGQTRYHSHYRLEVEGSYTYNSDIPGNTADAECSTATLKPTTAATTVADNSWQANRYPMGAFPIGNANPSQANAAGDALDLYVDRAPVEWLPTIPDAASPLCNSADHAYQTTVRNLNGPSNTRAIRFAVNDPFHGGAKSVDGNITYSFKVRIFPAPEPVASSSDTLLQVLTVDPAKPEGVFTIPLAQGQRYRFVADGVYAWDRRTAGNVADAECSSMPSDPIYRAKRSWNNGAVEEGVELLDLMMNDRQVDWVPLNDPTGTGCNSTDHTYRAMYSPAQNESVVFKIKHPYPPVASGTLSVRVYLAR